MGSADVEICLMHSNEDTSLVATSLVAQMVKNPPAMQDPGLDPWVVHD